MIVLSMDIQRVLIFRWCDGERLALYLKGPRDHFKGKVSCELSLTQGDLRAMAYDGSVITPRPGAV